MTLQKFRWMTSLVVIVGGTGLLLSPKPAHAVTLAHCIVCDVGYEDCVYGQGEWCSAACNGGGVSTSCNFNDWVDGTGPCGPGVNYYIDCGDET